MCASQWFHSMMHLWCHKHRSWHKQNKNWARQAWGWCVKIRSFIMYISFVIYKKIKLEQLERLHSEIPPAAPWLSILVIHITSQTKTKSKLQILKNCQKYNFEILPETLHATHLLKLLDKMYKYEMDPTKTVDATERTRDGGRTDGRTEGRTDEVKPVYPPQQLCCIIMYVHSWWTVYVLTRVLFCLFPLLLCNLGNKHKNNTRVTASNSLPLEWVKIL